ncbi:MAG: hypothetical protein HUU02_09985 [Bacteroidetes bacterium]|nr:hypothetical protein [Bacteroidota bacterium]
MIQIKPTIQFSEASPFGGTLEPQEVLWQGLHVCVKARCSSTGRSVIADLPVGHAVTNPCTVALDSKEVFCSDEVRQWLGKPLLDSLMAPSQEEPTMTVERRIVVENAVIINCIDHLYGHALLKLFNTERHLSRPDGTGVIVIVQDFLRWLVPEGVAEVWSVKLPLGKATRFHPALDRRIRQECERFSTVYVSRAYSHPAVKDITRFTAVPRHDDHRSDYRITFVWRDDRPWISNRYFVLAAKRTGMMGVLLNIQNKRIVKLFKELQDSLPGVRCTVAGIGTATVFPSWIDDQRVDTVDERIERRLCTVYAESRVVIGVHGSNMLLPSAHAGMTIDLMPKERWGNFAQDIVFQEHDPRIGSFRYRFFPISTGVSILAHLIATQVREFDYFKQQMSH